MNVSARDMDSKQNPTKLRISMAYKLLLHAMVGIVGATRIAFQPGKTEGKAMEEPKRTGSYRIPSTTLGI